MEHIRQFDWCYSQPDVYFLKEDDISHSVTEKILRNKFRNPMISSDSEDEAGVNINWDEIFTKKQNFEKFHRLFVPSLAQCPPYLKLSAMNGRQHYQCLKVLCAKNPNILPEEFVPRPTKTDLRIFEELKSTYEKEQKEYIEWAKTLWTTSHCTRALHPKPHIETVYEARFKMRANEMQSYPKTYDLAAQIPLDTSNNTYEMVLDKVLKNVNIDALPEIECRPITKKLTIIRACSVPEPCTKHPCRFILPNEKSITILPLTEIQRELAQYALDNNAQYVASENSVKCLVELDRFWDISVALVPVIGPDGEKTNVVVLGSEFSIYKEAVLTRTYRAFRHLLQHTLLPHSQKSKLHYKDQNECMEKKSTAAIVTDNLDLCSDEEDDIMCIDEDTQTTLNTEDDTEEDDGKQSEVNSKDYGENKISQETNSKEKDGIEFYNCTCKGTIYERPPPRSFKRWQVRNKTTGEDCSVVIHCAHKVRDKNGEVILEPIPEYQLDLGGSVQSRYKLRGLALALHLRENASLINVRVDGDTGEVATFEHVDSEKFKSEHGDVMNDVTNNIFTTFCQLQGLRPGNYVLRHKPTHGANALLYAATSSVGATYSLNFDCTQLEEPDESKSLKTPPTLGPVLLPYHKFRKILPCAFTPHEHQLPREPRRSARPPQRQKTPPRALQWPKRKRKKKNPRN